MKDWVWNMQNHRPKEREEDGPFLMREGALAPPGPSLRQEDKCVDRFNFPEAGPIRINRQGGRPRGGGGGAPQERPSNSPQIQYTDQSRPMSEPSGTVLV